MKDSDPAKQFIFIHIRRISAYLIEYLFLHFQIQNPISI